MFLEGKVNEVDHESAQEHIDIDRCLSRGTSNSRGKRGEMGKALAWEYAGYIGKTSPERKRRVQR